MLFAVVALVALAVCAGSAQAAFPGANGRIAFVSAENGDRSIHIYSVNADGTDPTQLTSQPDFDRDPVWSPDGTKIAFTRSAVGNDLHDLVVRDVVLGTENRLTNQTTGFIRDPAWSPGGNWLAFVAPGENPGSSFPEIYRVDAGGTRMINLTRNDELDEREPAWSPDGTKIAFAGAGHEVNGVQVFVMNADGSEPRNLTRSQPGSNHQPVWSPTGDEIAFVSDRDGNNEIYTMDADGTNVTRVTTHSASDVAPAWSPDGTMIVFQSSRVSPDELYVTSSSGIGLSTRLTTRPDGGAVSPDWQPLAGPKGNVTVVLELVDSENFRFDLRVGARVVHAGAGDGGSGTTTVAPGSYSLGPDPGPQNTLSNYVGSTTCTKDGNPYIANAEHGVSVDVAAGEHVVCTIRLVRIGHTATGANVVVTPVDATTGSSPVRIKFGTVTFAGVTELQTSNTGPPAPSGFEIAGGYYQLSTTAAFDEAEVCFEIVPPSAPTIAHWTGDPPAISTPATYYRNAAGAIVPAPNGDRACAVVTSFSPFALLVPASAEDAQPPAISCSPADGAWHGANVSIDCTAEDGGSGLADQADAAFSLSTSVPADSENGDAQTGSRAVCDRAGNCATAGPVVGNRVDRRAPTLTLPADKTLDAISPTGAAVSYNASASDGADPSPGVSCTHVSGSAFAIGTTQVACTATDHVGNTATGAFTVTVLGAKQQLARLIGDVVTASRLPRHVKTQLLASLEPIVAAFDPNDPAQRRKACSGLAAFKTVVGLLSGHGIPPAQATAWIADANRIRAVIGC
jgi:Tol biopolymer transport system component